MTTGSRFIMMLLSMALLSSCSQGNKKAAVNTEDKLSPGDSAKLEQYFLWSENIEYIDERIDLSVLSKLEKNRDTAMLLNFLLDNYEKIRPHEDFAFPPAGLVSSVYAIDFNGDSLPDIIYDGPTGGEQNMTQFLLNRGDYYQHVFKGYQDISKATFSDNKLVSFTLMNPGCCADPQVVEYHYSISYSGISPEFKLDHTIGFLSQTEKPQQLFSNPIDFQIRADHTMMRNNCYILEGVEHPLYGENGNVIGVYKKGAKGKALGLKKDKKAVWIFVLMNEDNKTESPGFPTFEEQPTQLKGWILKTDTDLN